MLEKILNMVKGQVEETVAGEQAVPEDKKNQVVQTATSSLIGGLKEYMTPEHLSSLTSLFQGNQSPAATSAGSGIAGNLQSKVTSALTSQAGLSSGAAQGIAASLIPAVLALFSRKVNDSSDSGFNIGSLVQAFTGNGSSGGSGNLMNMLGGLFGGKK